MMGRLAEEEKTCISALMEFRHPHSVAPHGLIMRPNAGRTAIQEASAVEWLAWNFWAC